MRSLLILASVAVAIAACTDDQQPTSPADTKPRAESRPSASTAPSTPEIKTPEANAKPTDQVGFTKVTFVASPLTTTPPNSFGTAEAVCPVGTVAIAPAYKFVSVTGTAPYVRSIYRTTIYNTNTGWAVTIDNNQPGAGTVEFLAYATCIS